jgi:hypothetical protein
LAPRIECRCEMSASLVGRLGSSAFRLCTATPLMSEVDTLGLYAVGAIGAFARGACGREGEADRIGLVAGAELALISQATAKAIPIPESLGNE